jgi:hypothetical protein
MRAENRHWSATGASATILPAMSEGEKQAAEFEMENFAFCILHSAFNNPAQRQ